jgi:DNA-binding NarL/FixJ family response regulator
MVSRPMASGGANAVEGTYSFNDNVTRRALQPTGPTADPPTRLRILIVDDSRLYGEVLAATLTEQPDVLAVCTACGVESVPAQLAHDLPDLVLLNLASVQSRSLVRAVRERNPDTRLIVVGVNEEDEEEILQCAEAGVSGFLTRSDSLPHLLELIHRVTGDETLCSPRMAAVLLRLLADLAAARHPAPRLSTLTDREKQILRLLELGCTNRAIAEELSIEVFTVKNHVHSVLTKLGVRRRGEAAAAGRGLEDIAPGR